MKALKVRFGYPYLDAFDLNNAWCLQLILCSLFSDFEVPQKPKHPFVVAC